MASDRQFDRKRMLETIDGMIEELSETDVRDTDGGMTIEMVFPIGIYNIIH